jgi:hypothetical protein
MSGAVSVLSGFCVFAAGGAALWYMMPTNGQVHPVAKMRLLDSLIPIAIVAAWAIGLSLIINGFM